MKVEWGDGVWISWVCVGVGLNKSLPFDSYGGLDCEPVKFLEHDSTINIQKYYES